MTILVALMFSAVGDPDGTQFDARAGTVLAVGLSLLFVFGGFGWKLCGRSSVGWIVLGLRLAFALAILTAYMIAAMDTGKGWSWSGEFVAVYSLLALSLALSIASAGALWRMEVTRLPGEFIA
ncbi:MAG: hypothetical protein HY874_08535 [Chloroflexi bacterium]|nr:hypothetical protein [Chloroflexota bacterium]